MLTNYCKKDGKTVAKESDHFTEILDLNITYSKSFQQRKEVFNLKNVKNQKIFKAVTSETSKHSDCFQTEEVFSEQCLKWKNSLFSSISESFRKIRITGKPKETEIGRLIAERNSLKKN